MEQSEAPSGAKTLARNDDDLWPNYKLLRPALRLRTYVPPGATRDDDFVTAIKEWLRRENGLRREEIETCYSNFCQHLWLVRRVFLPRFAATYFPQDIQATLHAHGLLQTPGSRFNCVVLHDENPIPLIKEIVDFVKTGSNEPQAMVAARDLALSLHSIRLMNGLRYSNERNRVWWNPRLSARNLRCRIFWFLKERGLVRPEKRTVRLVTCHEYLENRCVGVYLEDRLQPFVPPLPGFSPQGRPSPMLYDLIKIVTTEGDIEVLLRARYKDVVQTIAKAFETGEDTTAHVPDIAGACVSYRNEEELLRGATLFAKALSYGSGEKEHLDVGDKPLNSFADPEFKVITHRAEERDHVTIYEVQHTLAVMDVDRQLSRSMVNTYRYHLRRHTSPEGILRQLFPIVVDWSDPAVVAKLDHHVQMSIA